MEHGTFFERGSSWRRRKVISDQTLSSGYGEIIPEEFSREAPDYLSDLSNPKDTYRGAYWIPFSMEEKIILSRADIIELYRHAMEMSASLTQNSLEKEINILRTDNQKLRKMLDRIGSSKMSAFRLPENYFDEDFEEE